MKHKFTFDDVKIGDKVVTVNDDVGIVVAIKSYAYINDKFVRQQGHIKPLIDLTPFVFDETKHKEVWYGAVTLAVKDPKITKPTYHLVGIDFDDIQSINKDEQQCTTEERSFIDFMRALLTKKN